MDNTFGPPEDLSQEYTDQPNNIPETNTIQTGRQSVQHLNIKKDNKKTQNWSPPQQNNNQIIDQVNFAPQNDKETVNYNPPPQQQNNLPKYKIIDLYWLMNPKIKTEIPQFEPDEAHFLSISYNIVFGNMRITLFKIPQGAIQKHIVFYNKLQRLTTGTIYSSGCAKLFYSDNSHFTCMEQLFNDTGESWQQQRPMCSFNKTKESIDLTIADPVNGKFLYSFKNWQMKVLLDSCEFVLKNGILLSGQLKIQN